jgi:hypothetical protein
MSNSSEQSGRRRPRTLLRLSVRGFVILVLASGLCLGLLIRSARIQRVSVSEIERLGGLVWYDWEWRFGQPPLQSVPRWRVWLQHRFGAEYCGRVTKVVLNHRSARDAAFVHISRLYSLEELAIAWNDRLGPRVTDVAAARLSDLTRLKAVSLKGSNVTSEGVLYVSRLSNLRKLDLTGTLVDDVGLGHLKSISGLTYLNLRYTRVTESGVADLKQALPNLVVER